MRSHLTVFQLFLRHTVLPLLALIGLVAVVEVGCFLVFGGDPAAIPHASKTAIRANRSIDTMRRCCRACGWGIDCPSGHFGWLAPWLFGSIRIRVRDSALPQSSS